MASDNNPTIYGYAPTGFYDAQQQGLAPAQQQQQPTIVLAQHPDSVSHGQALLYVVVAVLGYDYAKRQKWL